MPFREIEFNYFISKIIEKRNDFRNVNKEVLLSEGSYEFKILKQLLNPGIYLIKTYINDEILEIKHMHN